MAKITWKSTVLEDLSNDNASTITGIGAGLGRAGSALVDEGKAKGKRITDEAYGRMAALTDRDTYAADAAGIMSGLDSRYANMKELAQFQQNRGTTLQNREGKELDMAAQRFKNANAPRVMENDIAYKNAMISNMAANAPASDSAIAFVRSHIDPKTKTVDQQAMADDMVNYEGNPRDVQKALAMQKMLSPAEVTKSTAAEQLQLGINENIKYEAKNPLRGKAFTQELSPEFGAHNLSLQFKGAARREYVELGNKLVKAGYSEKQATAILASGKDEGQFRNTWGSTPEMYKMVTDKADSQDGRK